MPAEETVNLISFKESAKREWYLSSRPASPKQTLEVTFQNGKKYKYLGTVKVNVGDPVFIDYGGATSYRFGEVTDIVDGITIKRTHALKPLFTFTTDPGKTEIKKNALATCGLDSVEDAAPYFLEGDICQNEDRFRPVDHLVEGILNAISVIAFPKLASDDSVRGAKVFLAKERPVPAFMFGRAFTDSYYEENYYTVIRNAECAEVVFTGFYPGWKDTLLGFDFTEAKKIRSDLDMRWDKEGLAYYLYFRDGSKKLEKYFSDNEAFRKMTNELVFRSALSILIRGGFANLLKAALSVEMPIKSFYSKLIAFADEIGSSECARVLKSVDYENAAFAEIVPTKGMPVSDKDFEICDAVLVRYKGKRKTVEIPDGVKVIGQRAFVANKSVEKVLIPDSVTQIKSYAFGWCEKLREVVLGKGISSFGNACFYSCKSLETIDLSVTKLKTLPKETFSDCQSLKKLDLSATKITTIKERVFYDSAIEAITLPSKLETIEGFAFNRSNIEELVIPASVKEISTTAFLGLGGLYSKLKRIVFNGSEPIKFYAESVGMDCVIACKAGSALMEMLKKQNDKNRNNPLGPMYGYAPRKIEAI